MVNYNLYVHPNRDGSNRYCYGSPAELVFTAMLRLNGLDVRPDNRQTEYVAGVDYEPDPELYAKQAREDGLSLEEAVSTQGGDPNGAAGA
jgi:hypothetical protein